MRQQRGYSYLIALFAVAVLLVVSLRALEHSKTAGRREREAELMFVGLAYQQAIKDYYQFSPGTSKQYPPDLQALLLDNRATRTRRPLRRLYRDPMTGSAEWGLVKTPEGLVKGVYSLSTEQPIKTGGFPEALQALEGAKRYQDWKFVFEPTPG